MAVLAGVNGAGKSSVLGAHLREYGGDFYNPDEVARAIRHHHPATSLQSANSAAWRHGFRLLQDAINADRTWAFETTLASTQITNELIRAANRGFSLAVLYVGLQNVDLHIDRVEQRRRSGGHHIPTGDIIRRFDQSPRNLLRLVPHLKDLVLFDNSRHFGLGERPHPVELLRIVEGELDHCVRDGSFPPWALPVAHAVRARFEADLP